MTINAILPNKPIEDYRSKLSKTDVQIKRLDSVKEGFLVNNFVKDTVNNNLPDIEGSFIIPQISSVDSKFKDNRNPISKFFSNILENPVMPLCLTALGVLGGVALSAKILHSTAKINLNTSKLDRLPDLPRNMNLNSENEFVTYMAIQNPSIKTILGAIGAISFAGSVFVVKNFVDGIKDIWVKKQEADIQKNLQENLIEVETKSFSGKNKIIRNLMREKADEMNEIMKISLKSKPLIPPIFEGFMSFRGAEFQPIEEDKKANNWFLLLAGVATIALCTIFTKKTIASLRGIGDEISKYNSKMHENMDKILSNNVILKENKAKLLDIFSMLNFKPEYVREKLQKAGLEEKEINNFIELLERRYRVFVDAPEALGGKRGIQYYSYIDDVQGHLYNWIMNYKNGNVGKFTRNLFIALATVSGLGYLGKTAVEAVKDVQVKKVNAQTDLSLHKNLVDIELRNFEAKKRSNINVLMSEFIKKSRQTNKPEKLHSMATEILYEIKNGAPFVYS